MKTNKPTYEELEKRLAEAEEVIRTLQDRQADSVDTGSNVPESRLNEEIYRSIVEDLPGLLCSFLPDGEIVFVNNAYCEYFDKTRDELIGSKFTSLIPEEDRQRILHEIQSLTVDSPSLTHEHRVIQSDGRIRWQRWTNRALFDERGEVVLFQSFGEDINDRRLSKEALKESERRFRELFEKSRDGFVVVNTEGRIMDANPSLCRMLGYSLDELKRIDNFFEITPPRWHDWERKEIWEKRLLQGGYSGIYEKEYIRKDGRVFPVEIQAYTVVDEEGKLRYIWGIVRDITDRKHAQEALANEKLLSEEYINSLPGLFYVLDEQKFIKLNSEWKKVTGYSDEELAGKYSTDFFDGESRTLIQERVQKVYRDGAADVEAELVTKDGRRIPYYFTGLRRKFKGKDYLVGLGIDITEQKQKENALRISEEKYRNLVENMIDVIFTLDATGRVTGINPSVKAMLGYEPEQFIGEHFNRWVSPDQLSSTMSYFERILTGEKIINETVLIDKDGKPHDVEFRATCIVREGQIFGVQGILRDITEHKRAQKALQEREVFTNTLLHAIPIPVFWKDKEGRYQGFNKAFERFLGVTKNHLIGKTVFDVNPPELAEIYHAKDKDLLENGGFQQYESQVKDTQDVVHDVIFNKAVYRDHQGAVDGMIGTILDVTEFIRAQEEIESLSKFPSENPNPVLRVSKDGTILYSNDAALRLLDILETKVGHVVPSMWRDLIDEALKSAVTRNKEEEIEGRIYSLVIAPCVNGGYVNLYGRDITERKKVEVDLQRSEERFKQVVENAGDWIWEVDTEGLYTYVSPVVEKVLGYKPEDIVGQKHFYDFFAPDVRDDFKKAAFEAFAKRESFRGFVNPNVHRNGNTVIFETSGAPIIDDKGHFCGYRGVDRDITERTQREEELRKLNADLVLATRTAGTAEVATDILHNVGNVLNSINVSACFIEDKLTKSKTENLKKVIDLLSEHTDDLGTYITEDERGKHIPVYLMEVVKFLLEEQKTISEKLRSLKKNVEHIKQIIKAQQSYARSGGTEAPMNIDEVIADAIEINHVALKQYGIDLRYELAELPVIHMDKQRVLQILVNLITNAKQAMAESDRTQKELTIRSYRHGEDALRIEVSDNGIGISKENLPRIFEHGFTTKKKGHGFGLHSCMVAAREMGGSLAVHSDGSGCGATFTLELPCRRVEVSL